ncbi:hypothetical protein ACFXP3_05550 [Streptomyces sp. NPDC059096]|uniref:hypothetical protein n=1 Tax=Streptomyces sp. NPDC059096 TaxID=3346727 RepID=UPI0036AE4D16
MTPVFENANKVFELLATLVRRPRKGELPTELADRNGIPVVCLIGDDLTELTEGIRASLNGATPHRIPHEFISMSAIRDEVAQESDPLPAEWQPVEVYRRALVALAQEFSSARNGRDERVRFRRFGLVNWLLESDYPAREPDSQQDRELLRRLREREFQRRRLFGVLRSPETEVSMQGNIPWWVLVLGLHLFPLAWFRAWRGVGTEYRWLVRQPYMAPRDPGTFPGFAMRLTRPRRGRENPDQVGKLMINAFLEDLRVAYRRRFRPRRSARRTAYCAAFLTDVDDTNHGTALIRSLVDVRNETGVFDPLAVLCTGVRLEDELLGHELRGRGELSEDLYGIWRHHFEAAGRSRSAAVWYLPVVVPAPLAPDAATYRQQKDRVELVGRLTVDPPPKWARRRVTALAGVVAVAVLAGGFARAFDPAPALKWRELHCGLSRSDPDAATLRLRSTGECIGVAPNGYAFGSKDPALKETLSTIARQNREADRIHEQFTIRPVVTLIHLSALLSSAGQPSSLTYVREALQGAASAQRRQLDKRGATDPVLRIFPASAGSGMRFGPDAVATVERMMRDDPSIVGVTGLDQSRTATITTIEELTRIGLPMVATSLSADTLDDHSPMYYQVSPQNRRQATVAAAYGAHLAGKGTIPRRSVRIVYSADPTDEYSENLRADAAKSFDAADFDVEQQAFRPSPAAPGKASGYPGPRTVGEHACGYDGLVFFTGRPEDFETLLAGVNAACGSNPPFLLGGDDVARMAADPVRRTAYPKVPFDFMDFTLGSTSCKTKSDLYSTLRKLFPTECEQLANTSLDGHASLAFDAVNLYLKAVGQLQDAASQLPLSSLTVWHSLSSIHGSAALDGESGRIDFGGVVDRQIPLDKIISVQRVDGMKRPAQVGFCGRWGTLSQSGWCPPPEGRGGTE